MATVAPVTSTHPAAPAEPAGDLVASAGRRWRRAQLVWSGGVVAYVVAVLHRSSLGVAGVEAVDRFGVSATVLSTFVVVQVAVYAGLQVPMGGLLDRFGPRLLISTGAVLMSVGQLLLSVVHDVPGAYLARILIGAGDAATFISVIRLVPTWFPAARVPLFTQLTGTLGNLGQLGAAVPLVLVLERAGWSVAFLGLAGLGLAAAVVSWTLVRDHPAGTLREGAVPGLPGPFRAAARTPGTWLGFWTHALSLFPMAVFLLLWGFPFLTSAQGLSPARAGGLMSLSVVATLVSGPVIGVLTARHPLRRSWMVIAIAMGTALAWIAVLARPEPSPLWLLVLLVVVLGVGGPGSAIGFDFARTFNPGHRLGTATGMVNVGGFFSAVVTMLAIGFVMDLVAGPPLSLESFRAGFAVMAVPWLVGVVGVLVSRRSTRRAMLADGIVVPPVREVLARRAQRRRSRQNGR